MESDCILRLGLSSLVKNISYTRRSKKCTNKFDCLVYEMYFINNNELRPDVSIYNWTPFMLKFLINKSLACFLP